MAVLEGVIRIAIFIIYIKLVSRMEDIRRTFMYHGAEHKCINCVEPVSYTHLVPRNNYNEAMSARTEYSQPEHTAPAPQMAEAASEYSQPERTAPVQQMESTRTEVENARMEDLKNEFQELDSGIEANGILEVMPDGFGFIRCENFLPGENDVYVAPSQIRRFNLKTGDIVRGSRRVKSATEKFAA